MVVPMSRRKFLAWSALGLASATTALAGPELVAWPGNGLGRAPVPGQVQDRARVPSMLFVMYGGQAWVIERKGIAPDVPQWLRCVETVVSVTELELRRKKPGSTR